MAVPLSKRTIYIAPKSYRNTTSITPVPHYYSTRAETLNNVRIRDTRHVVPQQRVVPLPPPKPQRHLTARQIVPTRHYLPANNNNNNFNNDLIDIDEVYNLIDDNNNNNFTDVPRKRERLTNLTAEEKINRRKIKNRVAAQTARDRKKERSTRLEIAVKKLLANSARLQTENRKLLLENQRLRNENNEFRRQNSDMNSTMNLREEASTTPLAPTSNGSWSDFGSAASINESLPWKRAFRRVIRSNATLKALKSRTLSHLWTILALISTQLSTTTPTTTFSTFSTSFLARMPTTTKLTGSATRLSTAKFNSSRLRSPINARRISVVIWVRKKRHKSSGAVRVCRQLRRR